MAASPPEDTIEITVTYLEMNRPPANRRVRVPPAGVEVVGVPNMPVHFYRYLYNTIGAPWHWWERRMQSDDQITREIGDPSVSVYVPYMFGVPAGLAEVDARAFPDIELHYFGLIPEFIGMGLGIYFLNWVVDRVWESKPTRFWLHTCTLDSPRAVPVYEAAGFVQYEKRKKRIADPKRLTFIA